MKDLQWWQKTVVYQVYPKSFLDTTGSGQGDIPGITRKLDYLKTLGVGAIWLTPVYSSPMVDNGYDIADYTAIDPSYGTMADMEELIAAAKKRDIRIVMDLVYNHTSDKHAWFIESKSSRDNSKADWYIWRDAKPDGSAPTNWRSIFGGSAWTWCEERQQYYLHTFAAAQPDLNWENPAVRQALYAAANFWLDKGVGGFRIDAIVYIKKPAVFADGEPDSSDGMVNVHSMIANTPGILDFLQEFRREVFDGHDIFTVAEANGVGPEELKDWVGEQGAFDMLFEFSHVNLEFPDGEIWCRGTGWKPELIPELKRSLTASQLATAENGWYPVFFENHDQLRCVRHFFPDDADPQVTAKAIATLLFTLRGTPFIYEGQELGMDNVAWGSIADYDDISSQGQYELALAEGRSESDALRLVHRYSRDNARTPMQWTRGRQAGFTEGQPWLPVHEDYARCCVESEAEDEDSVLSFYRRISRLRREGAAAQVLQQGSYEEVLTEREDVYAFRRRWGGQEVLTVVNFTGKETVYAAELPEEARVIIETQPDSKRGKLRPYEAVCYLGRTARKEGQGQ
ncbi:alpha-glucosidase [Selenomonas ruminantium]|uniref:Alpha-glucosidase n=1 Tax=Selenomonas ruminantium TaxID=971 RepID=A0A1I3EKD3_SELRU|nr:alpha-glucosidase [Selenomonas ruminantium]SFH99333.1 alpha-glucosidase [Selenomonas ruminantium]